MKQRTIALVLAACCALAAPSCSCSDAETSAGAGGDAAAGPGSGAGAPSGEGGAGTGGRELVGGVGGQGSTTAGEGGQGGACADVTITFEPVIPTVMLLVDQSGSMDQDFGSDSRWDALYDALMDPADGVVTTLQSDVRFGLALYTGENDGICPTIVDVPIALDNRDAIDAVYRDQEPRGDTPTGDSIDAILPDVVTFAEPGPKYVVLCTDGEPDTCEDGDADGRPEALAAAQGAFAQGVGIFVISVGDDVGEDHLQDMANAGVGLPIGGPESAPYWQALDAQGLSEAFDAIIDGVRSCVLTVDGEIDPDRACEGTVRIDGEEIPCDDPDGWVLLSPTEIELRGEACERIQDGEHVVDATFPCDAAETSGSGSPN